MTVPDFLRGERCAAGQVARERRRGIDVVLSMTPRLQNVHVPAVTFYRNDAPRYIGAKNLCAKILKAAGQIATRRRRTDV